jgi:flavodoxin
MKSLIVLVSYHHHNTEKVALAMAKVLGAEIKRPSEIEVEKLAEYDLVGFGSGIYGSRPHQDLLNLVERSPRVEGKPAFIFSTNGSPDMAQTYIERDKRTGAELEPYQTRVHTPLRELLISKGFVIAGEFACQGHNTNSFLRLFGGINKGRPDAADLKRAEEFASGLVISAR